MDYKKAIDNTLSDMNGSFRPMSNAEFSRKVQERAEIMSSNEKNTLHPGIVELSPVQPEHKSNKVFNVIAGIAGTAAVLAGAVFGLNWLNEHGGLKERGIESSNGAGYSQNAETTTAALPYTEPSGIVTTTAVEHVTDYYTSFTAFDLGDYKVSITGYEFNTVLLRLYYTVERNDGGAITETEAFGSVAWHGTDGKYTVINHAVTTSKGTSVSFIVDIIPEEPTHSLEVDIINSESQVRGTYIAKCDNSNYVFRLPCDVEGVDPHISELFVSQSEMILKYKTTDVNDVDFELPSVEVYMKGNYPISCSDAKNNWYDTARNVGYVLRGFSEPCDTSNIGRVYVGDVLVYEAPDIQYPATVTSAYAAAQEQTPDTQEISELLDFSSRTVRMEDWRYDGHILAVKLVGEADLINGKSLAFRSVSDPRNLAQDCVKEDGGTYTMWALLDVPEGKTEEVQIIEIPPTDDGIEVGTTITVNGAASDSPGIVLNTDMTEYGLPGVTLESMRLSTYGLELMFSCDKSNGATELHVDILLGNVTVPIKELNSVGFYDKDGLYHACTVVTADNMFGFDLTAASRVSVNGLTVGGDELTPGGADERRGIYDIMPRRDTADAAVTSVRPDLPE
ncbi:MAG: hypothetical protein J6O50_08385 [Ruminiclostridium sp.]|nr:hypothetical protein [Ruminiclostridium sp.]